MAGAALSLKQVNCIKLYCSLGDCEVSSLQDGLVWRAELEGVRFVVFVKSYL